jgi:DNA processing protein
LTIVERHSPGYPALLEAIPDPPQRLYVRGTIPELPMLAIVGSRRATPYGERVARRLAAGLAETGIAIVSGLARGIDSAAHRGALSAGGATVAVLATGLDRIYPPENLPLAEEIVRQGALVTEMPEQTIPLPRRFPIRNRLISGLSHGVIVVEAAERSGALITARMALEQGREVLAVPGSVDNPLTVGTHRLLKDGAPLVHTVEDVLEEFPSLVRAPARTRAHARTRAASRPPEPELFAVWELLDWVEPRHHDDLAVQLKLDVQEVSRRLTLLEMGNYIIGDCGGVVRRPVE